MTPDTLTSCFEQNVAQAERALEEQGIVHPLFVIVDEQGHTRLATTDFSSEDAKEASLAIVRLVCVADAAVAVFHRSEAWLVTGDVTPDISAFQNEQRIDVLLVSCVARVDGTLIQKVSVREIVRDLMGAVSSLRDLAVLGLEGTGLQSMELEGRMMTLLPAKPPFSVERQRARHMLDLITEQLAHGKAAFADTDQARSPGTPSARR